MPEKDGTGRLSDIDYTENYGWLCTAGLPIRDSAGNIHCYALVDIAVHNLISGIRSFAVYLGGAIVLLTALIAWVLTKDMKRSVSDPINAIARAAEAYTEDRKSGAAVTDRFSSLNIRTGDEIENLGLTKANEAICSKNPEDMFVTVWLGILELSTGRLVAASAGHEYPVLQRPKGSYALYKDPHGLVIGGVEGTKYPKYTLLLEPGARLFVYTDGVPEATNRNNELFGTERMIEALNRQPDAAPEQLLQNVREAVDGFVRNAEQFDDLTMLCVEYKGGGSNG